DPDADPEQAREAFHVHVGPSAPTRAGGRRPCDLPRRPMSLLRADDVTKWYGELEVLRGVTFEVGSGEVKVIIGPSGSGKSTLLRCMALLEEPDAGKVSLEGRRPGRAEVGMVLQRFDLFETVTALAHGRGGLTDVGKV